MIDGQYETRAFSALTVRCQSASILCSSATPWVSRTSAACRRDPSRIRMPRVLNAAMALLSPALGPPRGVGHFTFEHGSNRGVLVVRDPPEVDVDRAIVGNDDRIFGPRRDSRLAVWPERIRKPDAARIEELT